MAESAVSAVVGSIGNLAVQETSLLCGVHDEVEFLKGELTSLQCFLKDADAKWRLGNASVANWVRRIRDVAYEAENIIEVAEYMAKRNRLKRGFTGAISRNMRRLPQGLLDLQSLKDLVLQEMEELPKECYEELEKKGCKVTIKN